MCFEEGKEMVLKLVGMLTPVYAMCIGVFQASCISMDLLVEGF